VDVGHIATFWSSMGAGEDGASIAEGKGKK
jgi:hypothetical protein